MATVAAFFFEKFNIHELLAATALAAPSLDIHEDIKYKEILVKNSSTVEIFGSACSTALITGIFADFGIIANVGPNNPKYSGRISYYRMYNEYESFMVCNKVPLPNSVRLSPVNKNDRTPYFAVEAIQVVDTFPMPLDEGNSTSTILINNLEKRQTGACSMWSPATRRVGDGNPHQNYWHKQLSSCSVGALQSKSYTIGWTASATAAQWITGGFAVQASWTTGLNYGCTGHAYETVCLWYNTAHTAYTVQSGLYNQCTGFSPNNGGNFVMFSPNQNNKGGGYYCVVGTCRSQGQNYWDKSGRPGGP
ncbi:hypothetical protein BDV59DRAFT_207539 [Aspergillus ambiguus]|uniref:uncharacterized protein n=1 Tax=Aspergillus ambiguus TaxID=176160 RepID=UPI003CCDEE36